MNSQQRGFSQCNRTSFSPKGCDYPMNLFPGADMNLANPGSVSIPAHLKTNHMTPEPPNLQGSLAGDGHNLVHLQHSHNRGVMFSPHTRGSPLAVPNTVDASMEHPINVSKCGSLFLSDQPSGASLGHSSGEWTNERQRELEEARARTAQMEKTMRWWSDCTANWREKWAKVRNERNKAREEIRSLRHNLDKTRQELENYRKVRNGEHKENDNRNSGTDGDGLLSPAASNGHTEALAVFDDPSNALKRISLAGSESSNASAGISAAASTSMEDQLRARLVNEREEKVRLLRTLDQLQNEVILARNSASSNSITKRQEDSDKDTGNSLVGDLRRELERLQQENAAEWAHRDRLESEKLALERENKHLHSLLDESEKLTSGDSTRPSVMHQSQPSNLDEYKISSENDPSYRLLLNEFEEKDKEAAELKRICNRQRRQLEETKNELEHSYRRIEQYEVEVRKLRTRIDVLKRDLLLVENELDSQLTACRRIGHSNEELTQKVSTLQMQLEHAHKLCDESGGDNYGFEYYNQASVVTAEDNEDDENCDMPTTVSEIHSFPDHDADTKRDLGTRKSPDQDVDRTSLDLPSNPSDVLEDITSSPGRQMTNINVTYLNEK